MEEHCSANNDGVERLLSRGKRGSVGLKCDRERKAIRGMRHRKLAYLLTSFSHWDVYHALQDKVGVALSYYNGSREPSGEHDQPRAYQTNY